MRSIVAVGLSLFATCLLALEVRADDTAATCPKEGKCCQQQEAGPTYAVVDVEQTGEQAASTRCLLCPVAKEVKTEGTACSNCSKCTECKTCPAKTQEVATEAAQCTQCTGGKSCCKTEEVKAAAAKCTKECAACGEGKSCPTQTAAATACKGNCNCQSKCAPAAPEEIAAIVAQPIRVASLPQTDATGATMAPAPHSEQPRQYTVQMRIVEGEGADSDKVLSTPTIAVVEGNTASVGTHESRPFVTGVRKSREGRVEPIITVLSEGTQIEVRVTSLAKGRVQLDATVEMSTIDREETVESPFQTEEERDAELEAPEVSTQARRVVRAVQLGEAVKINCHGAVVQLTVDEVGAPTPGITPITQASAEMEAGEEEMLTEVYHVGDLLEPYAIHKEGKAVEAADFLPVIDMLLTEAGCNWPKGAQIQPFEENQAVVINQTREGHKAIARYLSAKRAAVAEIEANLLRK